MQRMLLTAAAKAEGAYASIVKAQAMLAASGGLAAYLATGADALVPLVVGGAALCLASMVLFLAILIADARRTPAALDVGSSELAPG